MSTISDEDLAKIAWLANEGNDDPDPTLVLGVWEASGHVRARWTRIARAVRAALTPAVAPLAPGETVTIMDGDGDSYSYIKLQQMRTAPYLSLLGRSQSEWTIVKLDLAGVRQLENTCRRARAAMEGE